MVVFAKKRNNLLKLASSLSLSLSHVRLYKQSHRFIVACRRSSSSCSIPFLVLKKKINLSFIKYQFIFLFFKKKLFHLFKKKNCFTCDGMCIQFHLQLTIDLTVIFHDLLVDSQTTIES